MSRRRRSLIGSTSRTREPADASRPPEVPRAPAPPTPMPSDHGQVGCGAVPPPIGRTLGLWRVEEVVGRVQDRWIVQARHTQTDRIRTSLVIAPGAGARESLVREAEHLSALDHPNLPRVKNVLATHDPPYLELELVQGELLDGVLSRRRALFLAEALELVEQVLSALIPLHARGVHHRDLRPGTLLVRKDGVVTILGFAHASGPDHAGPAEPPTPPAYLPPEWPDTKRPAEGDLYAVGCLLAELVSGTRPFGAPLECTPLTRAVLRQARAEAPFQDPGSRFHEDLRTVVRHLTTREPAGRLGDAAEALARVQAVQRTYA